MFSRLVSRAVVQSQPLVSRPIVFGIQKASSAPEKPSASTKIIPLEELEDPLDKVPRKFVTRQEGPERDLVNFPRPVVKEHPDPVRFGFVPDEWFEIFYKKTGVSGPYMFGLSVGTWLLSKEIFVLEHNFYNGISLVLIIMIMHHKLGPKIAAWADKEMEREDKELEELDADEKDHCRANIKAIDEYLSKLEVYKDIANVKREIAGAALEVTYREWMKNAYTEAKKRLDFQLALAEVERRVSQKNVSSWVTDSVLKSITPAQEQEALKKCILDLKSLSASA